MKPTYKIIIAGAGGIAEAAGLLLAEWSETTHEIFIGNRHLPKAERVGRWIEEGCTKDSKITPFLLPEEGFTEAMNTILEEGDILLDCLPGSLAPRMAALAKDFHMDYVNLTEYVAETEEIIKLAKGASNGFVLQSGIAPGYIDVLAHGLYLDFCRDFEVEKVDKLEFKVGALTDNAVAPHYYGFTWSPIGVATEYLKEAIVLRDFQKTALPSLSEKGRLIIDGITYEDNLTSGGAADLPDALAGKVHSLDYKTIRYPGHYDWVQAQLQELRGSDNPIAELQARMEAVIPNIEDDCIILYAAVEGKDAKGILRRREVAKKILPQRVGKHKLRAIQTTTAVPMLQAAEMLLDSPRAGVILQSQLDPQAFLNGKFVAEVYGKV